MPILTEEERLGKLIAGRYRLESILGRGGTGVVFAGTHTWTGRRVAVKLLKPEYARDLGLVRRFLQEARTAAGIEHPNVVQVLDMGNEKDGTVYLVLELLVGRPLSRLFEEEPRLSPAEALSILVPIMDALVVAHERGVVHRDLKPDNVYLKREAGGRRTPKLLDFGMAKMVDAAWGHATQSGTLVGTPFYMSPEQAEGKPDQGVQCDVWSMGVILHRCLTGRLPYQEETPTALLLAIVKGEAPGVRVRNPEVPQAFARVVDRALEVDRATRWPTMTAFLDALRTAAEATGIPFPAEPGPTDQEPPPPFDPGPRRDAEPARDRPRLGRAAVWAALALLVVGTAVGVAMMDGQGGDARARPEPPATESGTASSGEAAPPAAPTPDDGSGPAEGPVLAGAHATPEPAGADVAPAEEEPPPTRSIRPRPADRDRPAPRPATSGAGDGTPDDDGEPEPTDEPSTDDGTADDDTGSMRIPGVTREW